MRFCPWYALDDAATQAPAGEGVLQVRIASGLIDYPRGKSAMVWYAHAADVRAAAVELAARHAGAALLCRHLERDGAEAIDAAATYARLVAEFERRFGAPGAETRGARAVKVVEAEITGPIEGEDAILTPPRPRRRRVSVSLVFTICVLGGLVTMIYEVFPARHHVLVTEAFARHRDTEPAWDLVAPTAAELRAWAIGAVDRDVPLPPAGLVVIGARRAELDDTAVIQVRIAGEPVTYLVQHARGMAPEHAERDDGDLRAVAWRRGAYECVAVGGAATAARWLPAITPGGS